MTEIILGLMVLISIYVVIQNKIDDKRRSISFQKRKTIEEKKRREEEYNKKQIEAEKNRLSYLESEIVDVVKVLVEENDLYAAVIKKSDGSYSLFKRRSESFILGPTRINKKVLNGLTWISDEEYKRRLLFSKRFELLNSLNIQYLYHITHIRNLPNILENGLKSHNLVNINNLKQVDISDIQVNDRRIKHEPIFNKSIHDYVPLYFNPKNPMLFRRRDLQKDIIILAINRNILFLDNVIFTNGNAAASSTLFFKNIEDVEKLDWKCINAEYWNDFPDGKRIKCSEVLVYSEIKLKFIMKIFCLNEIQKNFITNELANSSNINVEINKKMYFDLGNDFQNSNITNDLVS